MKKMDLSKLSLAIVGTGHIGCSVGLALRSKMGLIAGVDPNRANIELALRQGFIDVEWNLRDAIQYANVIVVATPVDVAIPIVAEILDYADEHTIVIDMGSTKAPICQAFMGHLNRSQFVAAHPMAGSSVKGPQGADGNLFVGCNTYICEPQLSSEFALQLANELFAQLGSRVFFMEAVQHDRLVGLVSHLPQMLAFSLCNVVRAVRPELPGWAAMASTGFDSASRLALSPSNMWLPIAVQNKSNISIYLKMMIAELKKLEKQIADGNQTGIANLMDTAVEVRKQFETHGKQLNEIKNGQREVSPITAA